MHRLVPAPDGKSYVQDIKCRGMSVSQEKSAIDDSYVLLSTSFAFKSSPQQVSTCSFGVSTGTRTFSGGRGSVSS
jgi:hypothetical protein